MFASALKVTAPFAVPLTVETNAPPAPTIVTGSSIVVRTSSVAPAETEVEPAVVPRAVACDAANVPSDTEVVPV